MNDLNTLIQLFEEIAFLENNEWKKRSYKNAISILRNKGEDSFNRRNHFADIPGIGKGIEEKILEFKDKGSITKLNELRLKYPNKLDNKYYKVRKSYVTRRIPYEDAIKLFNKLKSIIGIPDEDITLCGSARRHKDLIGDIDIVISSDDKNLLNKLKSKLSKDYEVTVGGDKKLSFIIDKVNNTPVDIYVTSPETYYPMILFLTGSMEFNVRMRANAKKLNYVLNQYGLYDKDKNPIVIPNSEKDIFDALNMDYVEPINR